MNDAAKERAHKAIDAIVGDDDRLRVELQGYVARHELHPQDSDPWLEIDGAVSHETTEGRDAFKAGLALGLVALAELES